jgi:lysine 2,3-aminomutase
MNSHRTTLRSPAQLAGADLIGPDKMAQLDLVAARYAVSVTPTMADLIDPSDPEDPIARQFVPRPQELEPSPAESADPIDDEAHSPVRGVVHRYRDRVLLKLTLVCPVYCRFCFRREMVGPGRADALPADVLEAALAYVEGHPEIWEVVITGGDPLVLSARRLAAVTKRLAGIEHVKVVRWHTRVPVVAPERVDERLVAALKTAGKATYVALHANHPREFTPHARQAIARLVDAGIPMVSQTVLLRGVNDDAAVLGALMRAFVENRVKPYYLHHADLAPGTGHFRTTIEHGQSLAQQLRGRFSGLCQPTYVLDIPGGHGKVPIGPSYFPVAGDPGQIRDPNGRVHTYPPRCPTAATEPADSP